MRTGTSHAGWAGGAVLAALIGLGACGGTDDAREDVEGPQGETTDARVEEEVILTPADADEEVSPIEVIEDVDDRDIDTQRDVETSPDVPPIGPDIADTGLDEVADTQASDVAPEVDGGDETVEPPPVEAETLFFVRLEGAAQGVFAGWDNPWLELGGLPLEDYGPVVGHGLKVSVGTTSSSGGPSTGRVYEPVSFRAPLSGGIAQALSALRDGELLDAELLSFRRVGPGAYTAERGYTLTEAQAIEVEIETSRADGRLETWALVRLRFRGIGVTDYETQRSYVDE